MSDRIIVDLFVEDRAHEELLKPLMARVADKLAAELRLRVRSGRGGHARAISEFKLYQRIAERDQAENEPADLVVVAIDGNCSTFTKARNAIRESAAEAIRDQLVVACPDPHVERWYIADPQSFETIVGRRPTVSIHKCARGYYKEVLTTTIEAAGHPPTLGGIEFATELVAGMDLYRAGRNDPSLGAFLTDLRAKLRTLLRQRE